MIGSYTLDEPLEAKKTSQLRWWLVCHEKTLNATAAQVLLRAQVIFISPRDKLFAWPCGFSTTPSTLLRR